MMVDVHFQCGPLHKVERTIATRCPQLLGAGGWAGGVLQGWRVAGRWRLADPAPLF